MTIFMMNKDICDSFEIFIHFDFVLIFKVSLVYISTFYSKKTFNNIKHQASNIVTKRYGKPTLRLFRQYEKSFLILV